MFIDPVAAAKSWLVNNPSHEAAVHVLAALASADRHEALAQATIEAPPGGTYVVVIAEDRKRNPIFTTTGAGDERKIVAAYMRYLLPLELEKAREGIAVCEEEIERGQNRANYWYNRAQEIERLMREVGDAG